MPAAASSLMASREASAGSCLAARNAFSRARRSSSCRLRSACRLLSDSVTLFSARAAGLSQLVFGVLLIVVILMEPRGFMAIGPRLHSIFVDNGLLRAGDRTMVEESLAHLGLDIQLDGWGDSRTGDPLRVLFNEELGAVVQVPVAERAAFADLVAQHGLIECAQRIARPSTAPVIRVSNEDDTLAEWRWEELFDAWWSVTHAMQKLRDNPECADSERDAARRFDAPGLQPKLTFDAAEDIAAPFIATGARPKVAILREQGVNSQIETAVAFDRAGFDAFDVHMSDLIAGRFDLKDFSGFVACGGFSYGDVLGAGRGWATSILERNALRDMFEAFFARDASFSLGICNGCQMLAQLRGIIPGAEHWPTFQRNAGEQYEARLALLEVGDSPSLFLRGMAGSRIPVAVAHGEGRAVFDNAIDQAAVDVAVRYVEGGRIADSYPANPNGSPDGIAGVSSRDGRATILMPHPERTLRTANFSWAPRDWPEDSPWLRMFRNARVWLARS